MGDTGLWYFENVLLVTNREYYPDMYDAFSTYMSNNYGGWSSYLSNFTSLSGISDSTTKIFVAGHVMASGIYTTTSTTIPNYDYVDSGNNQENNRYTQLANLITEWVNNNSTYANAWYDYTALRAKVSGSNYQSVAWLEALPKGKVKVQKKDKNTGDVVEGGTFSIYQIDDDYTQFTGTVATDVSAGTSGEYTVDAGRIYCARETGAPEGYNIYPYDVCERVNTGETITIIVEDEPDTVVTGSVEITKTADEIPANLTVDGSVFGIFSSSTATIPLTRITVNNGKAGAEGLEPGTYWIEETQAATGFVKSPVRKSFTIPETGGKVTTDVNGNALTFQNTVIKGGFTMTKKGELISGPFELSGATFQLMNLDTEDVMPQLITSSVGLVSWSNLPYGRYRLTEVESDATNIYNMIGSIDFSITTNGQTVDLDALTSEGYYLDTWVDDPSIESYAAADGSFTGKEVEIGASKTIYDKMTISGLKAGMEYRVEAQLYAEGTVIKTTEQTFTQTGLLAQELHLQFTGVNTANYVGKTLAVRAELQIKSGSGTWIPRSVHNNDLTDEDQQVTVKNRTMSTTATTQRTSDNKKLAVGTVKVIDAIKMNGLNNGATYYLRGILKNSSGTAIKTVDATYTMSATTGSEVTTTMEFEFDSSAYKGQDVYVEEYLYTDSARTQELMKHTGKVAEQTVTVLEPTIGTVAKNGREGVDSKEIEVGAGVKIKDTVSYTGLVSGGAYKLSGKVVYGDCNSGTVVASKEMSFVASGETGSVTMVFENIDTSTYSGKSLLVCEYLDYGNNRIAEHTESNSEQTVTVKSVSISTSAKDGADGDKNLEVNSGQTVVDTVTYAGLTPGSNYTLVGKLYKKVDETLTEVRTGTAEFTASTTGAGTAEVRFTGVDTTSLFVAGVSERKLVVYEKLYSGSTEIAKHESMNDTAQILDVKVPAIGTTATDKVLGGKVLQVGQAKVKDVIAYSNLVAGKEYRISGVLMDKETGQVVRQGESEVIAAKTFTATAASGTVEVEFALDTTLLFDATREAQKDLVAYEKLYIGDTEIAKHEDLNDEAQTVRVGAPAIGTTATDKADDDKALLVGEVTIKDVVSYEGLVEGDKYKIVGTVMDKETGAALEIGGERVGATATFTAGANGAGTTTMEISLDTTAIQGKTLVVFEKLYRDEAEHGDGRELAKHEDINDVEQTVTVKRVNLGTVAKDKADENNVIEPEEEQTVVDTVSYTALMKGEKYTLRGVIMNKETGEELKVNGEKIETVKTFTTAENSEDGQETTEFEIDAKDLPGAELVVFEYLYRGEEAKEEELVAKHEDINDGNQFIKVRPRVGTAAVDQYDGDQEVGAGNVIIEDSVKYEGLKTGQKYMLVGTLMDKEKHEAVKVTQRCVGSASVEEPEDEGVELISVEEGDCFVSWTVMSTAEFTVGEEGYEETTAYVKMLFEFNSREYVGKELVVFEKLYILNGETWEEEAVHEDFEDESQTVKVAEPKITTTAVDKLDEDKELAASGVVVIEDRVEYTGLVAGTRYTLKGKLMDKKTGEELVVNGEKIEVEKEFTPDRDAGTEIMDFELDVTGLSGAEIVVFEELYIEDVKYTPDEEEEYAVGEMKLAEHADLEAQKQTVWVKVNPPDTGALTRSMEGAARRGAFVALGGIVILSLGAVVGIRLNRKNKIRFN